jgi:hypothetical protein
MYVGLNRTIFFTVLSDSMSVIFLDLFGYRSLNICRRDNERTVEMSYP